MAKTTEALTTLLLAGCLPEAAPTERCVDADGDGFTDAACGGEDCDDADETVNPEAWEGPVGWRWETVDSSFPASSVSAAIDGSGVLHVAYAVPGGVQHASLVDGGWTIEQVSTGAPQGRVALVLSTDGVPELAWCESAGVVRHASAEGSGWTVEDVATALPTGGVVALAFDPGGVLHAAFSEDGLLEATRSAEGWDVTAVVSGEFVGAPAIAIDAAGVEHLAFAQGSDLVQVRSGPDGWVTEVLDRRGSFAEAPPAIVLAHDGSVHLFHQSPRFDDLRHTVWDGATATTEIVDEEGRTGESITATLDATGSLHVGYRRVDGVPRHAVLGADGTWTKGAVDFYGVDPAIAVDADGVVQLFYAWGDGPLRHAWTSNDPWTDLDCSGGPTEP